MRRTHLAACAAIFALLVAAPGAVAKPAGRRLDPAREAGHRGRSPRAPEGAADDRRSQRRHALHATPGYTASAAYVKATLEKAGYEARYEMFNMPEWQETAAPVLQLTAPASKTYEPGTAADDGSTERRLHRLRAHADEGGVRRGRPRRPHGDPGRRRQRERLRRGGLTRPRVKGAIALIQRGTCSFVAEAAARRRGGRHRRDPVQRGRHRRAAAGAVPLGRSRATRSRPCSRATRSAWSSTTSPRAASTRRSSSATSGVEHERLYPNVVAETKRGDANHKVLAGAHLDSVPAGPGHQRRRLGHRVPARARGAARQGRARRRATRSASCGSAARRTAWSARSTTRPTCPTQDVANTDAMIDTDMISLAELRAARL